MASIRWVSHLHERINFYNRRCSFVAAANVKIQCSPTAKLYSYGKENMDTCIRDYLSLMEASTTLMQLEHLHANVLFSSFDQNNFLRTKLVVMYVSLSCLKYARRLFDEMSDRNVLLWNFMIREYGNVGQYEESLKLYHRMQEEGVKANKFTFPFVLKACTGLSALQEGKEVHHHIVRSGNELDVFVAASLIDMYGKCGSPTEARHVFDKMPVRDLVSWNSMIAGYGYSGYSNDALVLFNQMHSADLKPSSVTMVNMLSGCSGLGALEQGKGLHAYAIKTGLESNVFVATALIDMYSKNESIENAGRVFDCMHERNLVSWNMMITAHAQHWHVNEMLILFGKMQAAEVKPNSVTIVSVLSACARFGALDQGKCIYTHVIKRGFKSNVFVSNAIIDMYAKCSSAEDARQVFNEMATRDVISWTSMIAAYVQNGHNNEALSYFYQMQLDGVKPDSLALVSVLSGCASAAALQEGQKMHNYIIKNGFELDVLVGNSLIDMYAKCGSISLARQLFDKLSKRNVVSWSAMIAGYAQNGHAKAALELFNQMQLADVKPNSMTMVSVLSSYAQLGALQQAKRIHDYVISSGMESDVFVSTAIIDMYAKCGGIEIGRQLFDKMSKRNVVTWNTLIAGYGMHGHGKQALTLFCQMQQACIKPNHITLVSVLSACSHAGLVEEGWQYFNSMDQYGIVPTMRHYACMVDLLGRAGHLNEAENFIQKMPLDPDASVWGALLAGCRIHNNIDLGERVAERLFKLQPENAGYFVLLSNIYAAAGRWDDVAKIRTMMKDKGTNKTAGCSFIELSGKIHAFIVGDKSHPQSDQIYAMLETLIKKLKDAGYVPCTNFVLHDVEEDVKEVMLYSHSEKLAISFGLINTSPGSPIWITKNLRVCGDCHIFIKLVSKIVKREITVRDKNRFHHFKDGLCSCKDYW
ncbi:pentatricopeptide repeat-containing protein At3g12770-like [Cryptomeria japonica]|uniref:pentatricopeptide repeat-containing protein At3g12770-like n=1 Tax=Cryptomeria japonica TaxID=3369 RepID=UPI0025ABC1A4|nr:pentatricopeptide repeat-containing protein At3g12770-like [Cryptomeria japonica]